MLKFLASMILACAMLFGSATASAQTLAPPPPKAPAPFWSAGYTGDPGNWPTPEAACQAQRDAFNGDATLDPTVYDGGDVAHCHWHGGSGSTLPAQAFAHCPAGWGFIDPGVCIRSDYARDSRSQCGCGNASPIGSPKPSIGDPIELNYGAMTEHETDYASADGRFAVQRNYYSLGEDFTNVSSRPTIPGFGGRWHGVVPGRLIVWGNYSERIEYLNVDGGFSIFKANNYPDLSSWTWYTQTGTRLRLSIITPPGITRPAYFAQSPILNGPAEFRLDMAQGEYILYRRAVRYLVPVEHGYADGYKLFYTYPDTAEFPSTVSDSLGRQMTLTWADADRQTYTSLSASYPVKVISAIALPDGTSLQYNYGYGTDDFGSRIKDRLEGVKRLSASGSILWGRSFLYENSLVSYGLTGEVDQNGNRLSTISYDAAGLAASVERAGGVDKYTIVNLEELESQKFWRQVTNPLGHRTDYVFFNHFYAADSERVLWSVTEHADNGVAASSTGYTYSGYIGDMVVRDYQDAMGRTLHLDADSQLRPTVIREAVGTADARTTNLTWHPVFDLPTHEERPGLSIDSVYSATGLLLTKTQTDTTTQIVPYSTAGQTRTWTYSWNGNGRLLSVNGPRGVDATGHDDITSFTYDTGGNLLTSTDALGHITSFANYDANGRPGKMTDPNGIDTLFTYDPLGRVKTITVKDPAGASGDATTTLTYDVEGRVTSVAPPATKAIVVTYDLAGRVTTVGSFGAEKITYDYNGMSEVTAETVVRPDTTTARQITRTFDGLGRLLTTTLGAGRTTTLAYDSLGNATTVTAARSNATVLGFDGLNRLVSTVAPDSGTTSTSYDTNNNATSFTDPKTVTTTFVRDGFGDVIQEVSPDRGTSIYYYDAAGDRIAEIDGRGQRIDIVRDALGRITQKTPVGRPAAETLAYKYDTAGIAGSYGVGRLGKIVNGAGTNPTKFKYDHRGNLLIKEQVIGTTTAADLQYSYDLADRITSITYPSGRVVSYTRNTRGQVITINTRPTAAGTDTVLASGITYEPFGSMLMATFGNGLTMAQSWGNDGRLASKRLYNTASGTNLSLLTYGYDNDDNITSIADGVDPTRSVTYGYDPVNRLTQSVLASGSIRRQDFAFDANGNRTRVEQRANPTDTLPVSTATYTLNSGTNQLASVVDPSGTRSIAYDGRGNTLGETRPTSAITAGYDGYARLTSYQTTGGASLINVYDGLDDRVSAGTAADMRQYIYDGAGRMMGEYGVSATDVKAETIWLSPEVGSAGQPWGGGDGVGGYAPLAIATGTGGATLYWVHGSHLGVPIVTTDSAGNLAAPTGFTRVGFPGQTQTLADLFYNRYRDYDPSTGRYIQGDPSGLGGGSNPYLYANGNPLKYVDPKGRNPVLIGIAAGVVIGALIDWGKQVFIDQRSPGCINLWEIAGSAFAGGVLGGTGGWFLGGTLLEGGGAGAAAAEGGGAAAEAAAEGAAEGGAEAANAAKAGSQIDRAAFGGERNAYWRQEAGNNPEAYSESDLARMKAGKPPIGSDGYPTELHHVDGTPEGDLQAMTRTDHRLGDNYKANHPWIGK